MDFREGKKQWVKYDMNCTIPFDLLEFGVDEHGRAAFIKEFTNREVTTQNSQHMGSSNGLEG